MIQNVIPQPVRSNRIVHIVVLIGIPVICQLFGTKDEHRFVAVLIILDDRQGRESLAKTYGIRQNAPVELFQLIDNPNGCISLKIVEE